MQKSKNWLICLLVIGATLRLFAAFFSHGFNHPDELMQVLEPAYGAVNGFWIKEWEWERGIRSWFLPGIFAGLLAVLKSIGIHSAESVAIIFRALTGLFSLISVYLILL